MAKRTKPPAMWIREERDYGETVNLIAPDSIIVNTGDRILDNPALWQAYCDAQEAAGRAWRAVLDASRASTATERNQRRREMATKYHGGADDAWLPLESED